jgi:hypothetical protein
MKESDYQLATALKTVRVIKQQLNDIDPIGVIKENLDCVYSDVLKWERDILSKLDIEEE